MPRPKRAPAPTAEAIEAEVARIARAGLAELRDEWRKIHGRPPPRGLPRDLLARALAYRLQAQVFGDLDPATKKLLERIAKKGEAALDEGPLFKPGTVLVREWQGKLERVMVLEEGYAWNGKTYLSLSATARAITGTHWGGHSFFGLRRRAGRKSKADAAPDARRAGEGGDD